MREMLRVEDPEMEGQGLDRGILGVAARDRAETDFFELDILNRLFVQNNGSFPELPFAEFLLHFIIEIHLFGNVPIVYN